MGLQHVWKAVDLCRTQEMLRLSTMFAEARLSLLPAIIQPALDSVEHSSVKFLVQAASIETLLLSQSNKSSTRAQIET